MSELEYFLSVENIEISVVSKTKHSKTKTEARSTSKSRKRSTYRNEALENEAPIENEALENEAPKLETTVG